jgi:hypothetical protein
MNPARDPVARGEDLVEPDEAIGGRHRAEYASRRRTAVSAGSSRALRKQGRPILACLRKQ